MHTSNAKPHALVVGTGFGARIHVPALRAAGFDVVGLVGTDLERTQRRAAASAAAHAFVDLDEAISRTGAQVVTIATPPHTHAALSMHAMSRGCHVICEKPFAKDAAEARTMLDAARAADVIHLVGHEFRWQPDRAVLARAISQGLIGQPRFASFIMYHSMLADPRAKMPHWWFDPQAGGGWLGAAGSHVVDQVRITLGEFASVSAALPIASAREKVAEDSYLLRFRLVNGVEGVMQQTAAAWGPLAAMTRVAGTLGTVWIEDGTVKLADRDGVRDLPVPPDLALPKPAANVDARKRYAMIEFGPYTKLCEVLRARMEGKDDNAVAAPTFEDGVASMEVLDAIRRSAASEGALETVR